MTSPLRRQVIFRGWRRVFRYCKNPILSVNRRYISVLRARVIASWTMLTHTWRSRKRIDQNCIIWVRSAHWLGNDHDCNTSKNENVLIPNQIYNSIDLALCSLRLKFYTVQCAYWYVLTSILDDTNGPCNDAVNFVQLMHIIFWHCNNHKLSMLEVVLQI